MIFPDLHLKCLPVSKGKPFLAHASIPRHDIIFQRASPLNEKHVPLFLSRHAEDPVKFRTLELIVQEDISRKVTESGSSATCKLLWLKRALQYIVVFLGECVKNEEKDLSKSAQKAYDETLARVHGFIVRGTFFVAMKMAPKREEFLKSFGSDEAKVLEEMKVFTVRIYIALFTGSAPNIYIHMIKK